MEDGQDSFDFNVKLYGEKNTPYENGIFILNFKYPNPNMVPTVKFVTKIYHPNFNNTCNILIDKKYDNTYNVLSYIRGLMKNPNLSHPINDEIANEYKTNYDLFVKTAKEFTKRYAF